MPLAESIIAHFMVAYMRYPASMGAVRFGTFKSIDFKKNWYVKVPVVPRSLML